MKRILLGLIVLLLAGGSYYGWARFQGAPERRLDIQTIALARSDVRRVISTSGAVKARVTVEVSTQTSGQIRQLPADFNSRVKKGDLLALIDPAGVEAKIRQADAAVAVAEANVALASASMEKAAGNLTKASNDLERVRTLAANGTSSKAALDTSEAARIAANADLSTAKAQFENANALVKQRRAELDNTRVDLERTSIRSPIDGVVIDRVIEVGQTVSASSSAPKLFTLAEDLTRVEIGAQVDEADIGQVSPGNRVVFTVDAFPDTSFSGAVAQVRLSPTTVANVVTYTVIIRAENPGERLLPGMTANVEIITGERRSVPVVPNEALRFQPRGSAAALSRGAPSEAALPPAPASTDLLAELQSQLNLDEATMARIRAAQREQLASLTVPSGQTVISDAAEQGRRTERVLGEILTLEQVARYRELAAERTAPTRLGTLWTREADGTLAPHRVRLGLSDVSRTQILASDLAVGAAIAVRARELAK